MKEKHATIFLRILVLVNYLCLMPLLFFYKLGDTLQWNPTLIALELVFLAVLILTFIKVHISTGFWKLVHTKSQNLNESDIQITRAALAFGFTVFMINFAFMSYMKIHVMFTRFSFMDIVALIYIADTLPSSYLAWGGKRGVRTIDILKRWARRVLIAVGVIILALVLNLTIIRPWQHNWGATKAEANRDMPGDELVVDPDMNATRVVSVNAPPEDVWPWIVQLGYKRGGLYSYDFLDNDGVPSADRILPEYQNLRAGDKVPIGPGVYLKVISMDVNKSLVLQFLEGPWEGNTWVWGLYPEGPNRTRLVSRLRAKYIWEYPHFGPWLMIDTFEIIMMRKSLLSIKKRAESLAMQRQQ
jgi:hypothetical protein